MGYIFEMWLIQQYITGFSSYLILETEYRPPYRETSSKARDLFGLQASPHAFHPKEEDHLQ